MNQLDYGFRIYDPRIGRFLSVDPVTQSYPWYTPYQFAGNRPTRFNDVDGAEEYDPMLQSNDGFLLYRIGRDFADGVENIFFTTAYPQTQGFLIRRLLQKEGYQVPPDVPGIVLGMMFDIKSRDGQFILIPERSYLEKLFDLGIASIQVAGSIPTRGSVYIAIKTSPITSATIADLLKALKLNSRIKRISTFLDLQRGKNITVGKFEAESGSLLEEAFGVTLRGIKEGEAGDYAVASGKINGVDITGKTIDQIGIPKEALGNFKMEDLKRQIKRHLEEKGADIILLDIRNLNKSQKTEVSEYIKQNHAKDESRIITLGND